MVGEGAVRGFGGRGVAAHPAALSVMHLDEQWGRDRLHAHGR